LFYKGNFLIKIPELDISLLEALTELDQWLNKQSFNLELQIIGASALYLHHVDIDRPTIDIDLANEITNKEILLKIEEIGKLHGLGATWLETPGVTLPDFIEFTSHKLFSPLKNINVKVADLKTIMGLKIAAYYDRMNETQVDILDIKAVIDFGVVITNEILEFAITEIKRSPKYSEDSLEDLLQEFKRLGLMQ
jgi:hypothetical protein